MHTQHLCSPTPYIVWCVGTDFSLFIPTREHTEAQATNTAHFELGTF